MDTLAVFITRVWEYATDYKKSFTVWPTGYDVLRKQLRTQIVDLHLLWTLFENWMEGQTSITDYVFGVLCGRGWGENRFYRWIHIIYCPVLSVLKIIINK